MTARRDSDRLADDQAAGAPSPDALLPALDDRQLRLLHRVGREWDHVTGDPQVWRCRSRRRSRRPCSLSAAPTRRPSGPIRPGAGRTAVPAPHLAGAAARGFHPVPPPRLTATEGIGVLLVLRAFASGSTAMTGIEAISNAVPAFKPVEWRNARTTLTWMIVLLIMMFAGIVLLARLDGVIPNARQTVLSQLAHRSFGTSFLYSCTQAATAAILLLAANTAYNDFPRVLVLLARSWHAPRLFLRVGDRLAVSHV